MCFYITDHKRRAKKDILVYKLVSRDRPDKIRSSIKGFKYMLGSTYTTKFSYSGGFTVLPTWPFIFHTAVEQGYHSYTSYSRAFLHQDSMSKIMRCIIPKGTLYYINIWKQEYVSQSLKPLNFA